jgi:polysaccharide pyruvyl transferase WcaK-like protein
MRILHAYCLNYNVGDYALGFGVKNAIRSFLDVDLIGQTNLQGREFNEYYIHEVVNKRFDLLVIGGGGIIHGAHWPQGWFWLIEPHLISELRIPFIVYGAGYNYFEDETGIPERGIRHLHITHEHAAYFSVRNDGSYDRLKKATGISADVIPDPGFHVPLNRDWGPALDHNFVVIQLADDKSEMRYGSASAKQKTVDQLRDVVTWLTKRYEVILIPHVFEDIPISRAVAHGLDGCRVLDFSRYAFDQCESVMRYYRDARFVLAMRGHGQIVPIGFGTPVITFSRHAKIAGMMKELGLQEYNVPMNDEFRPSIEAVIGRIENNYDAMKQRIAQINFDLLAQTKAQFQKIRRQLQVSRSD